MTDDLDPSELLASAALDNEVDAEDRARVEASPELRREVQLYRSIGDEMRAVDVPADAREAAVAAALAAFDERGAGDATTNIAVAPGVAVVSLQDRRRRQQLWLGRIGGGLVAATLVVVVGVAALRTGSGDDKKSASTTSLAQTAASSAKSSAAGDASLATTAAAEAPNVASQTGGATDTTAAAGTVVAADTAVAAETAPVDPWAGAPTFTSPEELRAYSFAVLGAPSASSQAATAETTAATTAGSTAATVAAAPATLAACIAPPGATLVPIYYGGQRVYLVRDDAVGVLRLLDPANCAEIQRVPLR